MSLLTSGLHDNVRGCVLSECVALRRKKKPNKKRVASRVPQSPKITRRQNCQEHGLKKK